MAKQEFTVQSQYIQKLKESIPANSSLVDEMADLLSISTDSAYRRIRGETALTIDEVTKLCNHYKMSFDFTGKPQGGFGSSVTFNYHHLSDEIDHFQSYLTNIMNDMKKIKATATKEILFAAEDIPIFHHFSFKHLGAFKLYYWTKSILNVKEFEGKKFDVNEIPQEHKDLIAQIYDLYVDIPSLEIWSEDTINSTLRQVEYYYDSGLFKSKEDALIVLDEIKAMIAGVERQAAAKMKFRGEVPPASSKENYWLYVSDLMIGDNCILVTLNNNKITYLVHNTFNSMVTLNPSFCEETERWLKNLVQKSNPISGVSEKSRLRFFKVLNEKIERTRNLVLNG